MFSLILLAFGGKKDEVKPPGDGGDDAEADRGGDWSDLSDGDDDLEVIQVPKVSTGSNSEDSRSTESVDTIKGAPSVCEVVEATESKPVPQFSIQAPKVLVLGPTVLKVAPKQLLAPTMLIKPPTVPKQPVVPLGIANSRRPANEQVQRTFRINEPTSSRLPPATQRATGGNIPVAPPKASLFPAANSAQRASTNGSARKKVVLKQGHSPLDWANINKKVSKHVLRGVPANTPPPQFVQITKEELKGHKVITDCWTSINGKVFNITPYVDFHPGGVEEIMKCAGRDGTALFNKYHSWVNADRMLENCCVGRFEL